ncbi:MAG: hypothetical protein CMO55_12345 [Verrucomicrobiales bacterium]|nr:hypothetical protein [Verrucomicrobiales bacterium]
MRKIALWSSVGVFAILIAGYLALTVGTRPFIPKWWDEFEVGMPMIEAYKKLEGREYREMIDGSWHGPGIHIEKTVGFRNWEITLYQEKGEISEISLGHHDAHWGWIYQARLKWSEWVYRLKQIFPNPNMAPDPFALSLPKLP